MSAVFGESHQFYTVLLVFIGVLTGSSEVGGALVSGLTAVSDGSGSLKLPH